MITRIKKYPINIMTKGPNLNPNCSVLNGQKTLLIIGPKMDKYKASQIPIAITSNTKFFLLSSFSIDFFANRTPKMNDNIADRLKNSQYQGCSSKADPFLPICSK